MIYTPRTTRAAHAKDSSNSFSLVKLSQRTDSFNRTSFVTCFKIYRYIRRINLQSRPSEIPVAGTNLPSLSPSMALTLVTRPGTTLHICYLELLPWDPRLDMHISYDPVTELRAMIYRTEVEFGQPPARPSTDRYNLYSTKITWV